MRFPQSREKGEESPGIFQGRKEKSHHPSLADGGWEETKKLLKKHRSRKTIVLEPEKDREGGGDF